MDVQLLLAVISGIALLLFLILYLKIPAFISLLIASIAAGLIAGLSGMQVIETVSEGMASTLGFVATVVGLGAMFGAILEKSGGASTVANFMLKKFGLKNAPFSLVITGFIIAIPVFFDVAFIILVPLVYSLQLRTNKSLLLYAIPLLAGLAITHAFIPPTPGPVAVSEIVKADLGWVILFGIFAGIPTALVSGLLFGKYVGNKIFIKVPEEMQVEPEELTRTPSMVEITSIIGLPIALILVSSFTKSGLFGSLNPTIEQVILFLGHPFVALILTNLLAWYFLGLRKGFTSDQLLKVTTKSMAPAGTIILLTGAGGVFKQVLVNTGAGKMLAESMTDIGLPILLFGFLAAVLVRVIQGSATVAMITSAGLTAPLLAIGQHNEAQIAALVIAIASGASIMSHVNDSGFWLIKQYLGMTEKQTLKSWTLMTTILSITGFICATILFYTFG